LSRPKQIRTAAQIEKAKIYRRERLAHYAKLNATWIRNNRDKYNASKAKYRLKLKIEVMSLYADPVQCQRCGFKHIDGLVLDHIDDNGAADRKFHNVSCRGNKSGVTMYEVIRKRGKIDGLQVLCANCNTIKQLQYSRSKTIKDPAILQEIERIYAKNLYSS
jgi:hypothetical protein